MSDQYYDIKLQILNKIKEYDTIIIHRHYRPDGDCVGSSLGLRDILRESFPNKKIYSVGNDTAKYLEFMGKEDTITEEAYNNALVIVVDTSNSSRISGELYNRGKEIIKIDHHIETDPFGAINYVRDNIPSTTILIMDWYKTFENELKLSKTGARSLYVGTITDTGRFRYSVVNGDTLRLAGAMLDFGFDTDAIYANLHIKEKEAMQLQGYILKNFKTTKNGVSYILISQRLQKKFNVSNEDASSLVNTLDSIRGSLIWILFIESDKVIRARLRSRYVSIVEIANQFNGGGHMQASGATVKNRHGLKRMVSLADEALAKFKKEHEDLF